MCGNFRVGGWDCGAAIWGWTMWLFGRWWLTVEPWQRLFAMLWGLRLTAAQAVIEMLGCDVGLFGGFWLGGYFSLGFV
ncbi:hypothetical protein FH972_027150 [Carpinus fangiana]|uniref:Uncharacterized protein n=1 Tax=Carpinus fangiana TaxID=176857 RepID=A0A5N6L6V9_9ROSI|nr:hypothetical protein FH972_027150 [Carpinus fangiana]